MTDTSGDIAEQPDKRRVRHNIQIDDTKRCVYADVRIFVPDWTVVSALMYQPKCKKVMYMLCFS